MKYKVLLALACLISSHANAHKAGDWIIKAGPISVQPSVDSDPIDVAGLQTFENGVDVDNDVQLGLRGCRHLRTVSMSITTFSWA